MDISVIIVSYNTSGLLRDCLDSIRRCTSGVDYEVIVVDNDSHDGTPDMLRRDYPWVRLIESGGNLGFGRANNLGSEAARGKYLLYLNSDTILRNNALRIMWEYAESPEGADTGVIGAILLDAQGQPCHSYGRFITPRRELKNVVAKYLRFLKDPELLHPSPVEAPKDVEYITGAMMMVPRKVYESIGGFDPDFFMYCEEVDWQLRMSQHGLRRVVIPGPEVVHLEGGSAGGGGKGRWSVGRSANMHASLKTYLRKHHGKSYKLFRPLYLLLNTPSILLMGIKDPVYLKLLGKQ